MIISAERYVTRGTFLKKLWKTLLLLSVFFFKGRKKPIQNNSLISPPPPTPPRKKVGPARKRWAKMIIKKEETERRNRKYRLQSEWLVLDFNFFQFKTAPCTLNHPSSITSIDAVKLWGSLKNNDAYDRSLSSLARSDSEHCFPT